MNNDCGRKETFLSGTSVSTCIAFFDLTTPSGQSGIHMSRNLGEVLFVSDGFHVYLRFHFFLAGKLFASHVQGSSAGWTPVAHNVGADVL